MITEYISKMYEENEKKLNSLQREMNEIVTDINNAQAMMERLQYEKKMDKNIFSPRKIDAKADEKINECRIKIKGLNQRMEYVSQMVEECLNNRKELKVLLKELQEKNQKEQTNRNHQEILDEKIDSSNTHSYDDSVPDLNDANIECLQTLPEGKNESITDNLSGNNAEDIHYTILDNKTEDSRDISSNIKSEIMPDNSKDNESKDRTGTHSVLSSIEMSHNVSDVCSVNKVNIEKEVSDVQCLESKIVSSNLSENEELITLNSENAQNHKEAELRKKLLDFLNELYKHNEIALALVNGNKNRCKAEIRNSMSMIRDYVKKMENEES